MWSLFINTSLKVHKMTESIFGNKFNFIAIVIGLFELEAVNGGNTTGDLNIWYLMLWIFLIHGIFECPALSCGLELGPILVHVSDFSNKRIIRVWVCKSVSREHIDSRTCICPNHLNEWLNNDDFVKKLNSLNDKINLGNSKGRAPLFPENVQAYIPIIVYVWMEHFGPECDLSIYLVNENLVKIELLIQVYNLLQTQHWHITYLWWFERIITGKVNAQKENTTSIWTISRADDCRLLLV